MAETFDGVEQVQLRAGVWPFPAADQPGTFRASGQQACFGGISQVGQLHDLGYVIATVPILNAEPAPRQGIA